MQANKQARRRTLLQAMRELNNLPRASLVDIDPEDPTQLLDDAGQFSAFDTDLEIEAQPAAEAETELDAAVAESAGEEGLLDDNALGGLGEVEAAQERDTPSRATADAYAEAAEDTGELYGVHVPPVADKTFTINPDGESFRDSWLGEHAFETLEKKTAELGAEPEHELDIVDNSEGDRGHHATQRRDRPVADKGSGGSGGL